MFRRNIHPESSGNQDIFKYNINLEGIKCCETYRTNELALKTKYNYKIYTTTQDKGKYKKEQIT